MKILKVPIDRSVVHIGGWIIGICDNILYLDDWKKKLLNFLKNRRIKRSQQILQSFSDIFTPQQLAYMAVLGQSDIRKSHRKDEVQKKLPSELFKYRYLMNPIRLSIMKLLHEHFSLISMEIKDELAISWGDYANHINSLEKRKFVSIHTEFRDAGPRQIVYLEELGRQEYEAFIEQLQGFLEREELGLEISDPKKKNLNP